MYLLNWNKIGYAYDFSNLRGIWIRVVKFIALCYFQKLTSFSLHTQIPEMTFVIIACFTTDIIWKNSVILIVFVSCEVSVIWCVLMAPPLRYLDSNKRHGFCTSNFAFKESPTDDSKKLSTLWMTV